MEKRIILNEQLIIYKLKISNRARHIRLAVYRNGDLVITCPKGFKVGAVEDFIRKQSAWITKKKKYFTDLGAGPLDYLTRQDYFNKKEEARVLISKRLEYFNCFYDFKYLKINIHNQKTRWGSCSRDGSLNFNFRLLYLPESIRDYVIVHELCHLKELNHSSRFWSLVSLAIPDFRDLKKKLRVFG